MPQKGGKHAGNGTTDACFFYKLFFLSANRWQRVKIVKGLHTNAYSCGESVTNCLTDTSKHVLASLINYL